ncbi:MAG TPA: helix-turn-helix transcriptional regulator [Pirellulales bacterium]|jgi:DNA-binding PadR family transcriptional regulator|nr:helix-turn-helix transcriptional regulator [Pirellulales bacterium]
MAGKLSSELLRGSLDLMILSVLADEAMYGYSIQKRLADASNQAVQLQAGTLYPLLHRLESDKLIRSRWERSTGRGRKWYELTAAGHRRMHQQASEWHSYVACLKQLLPSMSVIARSGMATEST